jgi:hypothetical protein
MATPTFTSTNSPSPAEYAAAVTPSDSTDLATTARALFIGGAGNANVDMPDGGTVLFSGLAAGSILPVRVRRVRATSTTATLIIALY